jgi:hypothetical protein
LGLGRETMSRHRSPGLFSDLPPCCIAISRGRKGSPLRRSSRARRYDLESVGRAATGAWARVCASAPVAASAALSEPARAPRCRVACSSAQLAFAVGFSFLRRPAPMGTGRAAVPRFRAFAAFVSAMPAIADHRWPCMV